jgi:hypothetical protein
MIVHNHRDSIFREIIDIIGMILGREQCQCIIDGCKRRNILNNGGIVAGIFGEDSYICERCYNLHDREEIDEWSVGKRKFIQKTRREQPELLQLSKETYYRLNKNGKL